MKTLFPIEVVASMDMSVRVDTQETAKWYKKSFPNRNGMSIVNRRMCGYGDIEDITKDGVVVGAIFTVY